jgi:hypothetical protein
LERAGAAVGELYGFLIREVGQQLSVRPAVYVLNLFEVESVLTAGPKRPLRVELFFEGPERAVHQRLFAVEIQPRMVEMGGPVFRNLPMKNPRSMISHSSVTKKDSQIALSYLLLTESIGERT